MFEFLNEPAAGLDYLDGVNQYGGHPTFGGFQAGDWRGGNLDGVDVAVVGVPYDNSTAYRPGCRFGPRALRANAFTAGYHHLGLGVEISDWLEIRDVGDVFCPHGQTEVAMRNTRFAAHAIASSGAFPVFLGGDHAITWPAALSVAEVSGWGRLGIIHFDAHSDAAPHLDGNYASHGTPMRHLLESGALPHGGFEQIGLRGYWPSADVFEFVESVGGQWHLMDEVEQDGIDAVVTRVIERIGTVCDAVYLSVDIDVLDPGFAPATGTPEPGGMRPVDLFTAVRRIALETNLVGLDVMEYSPAYDHADITANNVHRTVFEVLAALAHKQRARRGGQPDLPATRSESRRESVAG